MKRSTTRETSCKPPSKEIRCRSKGCRYVKSKGRRPVRSEESSPKDDSSDRYTEETDEDVKGRGCEHWTNSDWNAFLRARHREDTRGVTHHPQNQTPRGHKKDKNTQKNLISPTPSFLPPTTRRGLITHLKNTMPSCGVYWASAEKTKGCGHHHEKDVLCFHHHLQETSNACSNNTGKVQYVPTHVDCHVSRRCHMHAPEDVAEVSSAEGNIYWPNSMQDCVELKVETPQSLSAEDQINECHKSSRTDQVVNKASMGEPIESEKELLVHDSFPKRMSADEAAAKKSTGKTREKLVYVVEEEGNDTTKMETDLFSVNEILTIKKDLLELSEFAKKLKKLKEMKNQEDKSKKNGKVCNCQPVTELLSDVNRRIEALEARQEELELARSSKQVACQNDSLTLNLTYPLEGRPHTSGTNNPSVDVTQFKPNNPDLIVSRAEGFPNNSEIVNELLDIKSQLQKLEQRKMSRESSSRAVQNQTETAGKKGHSIAVFSSRTYILASPKNLKKGKYDRNASKSANHKPEPQVMADESGNGFAPEDGKKSKTKTEKTKENVSNWLRNVPCDSTPGCQEFGVYTATDVRKGKAKEKESLVGQSAKCKKSSKESGESDYSYTNDEKRQAPSKENQIGMPMCGQIDDHFGRLSRKQLP
ncbi:hypothetical protein RUM44_011135 [Polyplax serrata]|uniref:Uncharacterized protein n=1 Tax=Polyplax serrata TaxID=468196 RepID=A0ABR1AP74_POLSC